VGSLLFLRFICPAIVNPQNVPGLLSAETLNILAGSAIAKRRLLLVVKILQQLVNGATFVDEHMRPINEWLLHHSTVISEFYRRVSYIGMPEELNSTFEDVDIEE